MSFCVPLRSLFKIWWFMRSFYSSFLEKDFVKLTWNRKKDDILSYFEIRGDILVSNKNQILCSSILATLCTSLKYYPKIVSTNHTAKRKTRQKSADIWNCRKEYLCRQKVVYLFAYVQRCWFVKNLLKKQNWQKVSFTAILNIEVLLIGVLWIRVQSVKFHKS